MSNWSTSPAQAIAHTVSYTVEYDFELRSDFKPYPLTNEITAGGPPYIRFSLGGNYGLDILADGSPTLQWHSYTTGQLLGDPVPAQLLRGLSYSGGSYQVVVRLRGSDNGRCGDLVFTFTDGTQHAVRIKFTKDR